MNILKDYKNNLTTKEFIAKCNELGKNGRFKNYINDKKLCSKLNSIFYFGGNNYIKDFINIIKNNKDFSNEIKDISIDNIVNDNDATSITINMKNRVIKIDFKNKLIYDYGTNTMLGYNNNFVIAPLHNKPIFRMPTTINSVFDMNDPTTKYVLSHWSENDRRYVEFKLPAIINNMPDDYKKEFSSNIRFFNKFSTATNFVVITTNKKVMQCNFIKEKGVYDCTIS